MNSVMVSVLVAALAASPALAQTAPDAAAPSASGTYSPITGSTTAADFVRQAANSDMFEIRSSQLALKKTQDNEVRAFAQRMSKLISLNVYNLGGDRVGDINDVLVDRSGTIKTVVIVVGGFLGLGEHDVAVPFSTLQWVMAPVTGKAIPNAMGTSTGAGGNTVGAPGGVAPPADGYPSMTPGAAGDLNRAYSDHAVLPDASRDQLKNPPEFHYATAR